MSSPHRKIPTTLKMAFLFFVVVFTIAGVNDFGIKHLLWLCYPTLWAMTCLIITENANIFRFVPMCIIPVLFGWLIDFGLNILELAGLEVPSLPIADPIFEKPRFDGRSVLWMFHGFLLWLIFFTVNRIGYPRHSTLYQIVLTVFILLMSRAITDKSANINWVYGLGYSANTVFGEPWYFIGLICVLIVFNLFVDFAFRKYFS